MDWGWVVEGCRVGLWVRRTDGRTGVMEWCHVGPLVRRIVCSTHPCASMEARTACSLIPHKHRRVTALPSQREVIEGFERGCTTVKEKTATYAIESQV